MMKKDKMAVIEKMGLKFPGDEFSGRITKTERKVLKAKYNNGIQKYSATQYKNGTIVETRTIKAQ